MSQLNSPAGYEPDKVSTVGVAVFVAIFALGAVLIQLVIYAAYDHLKGGRALGAQEARGKSLAQLPRPPLDTAPQLQGTPDYQTFGPPEVAALREKEERFLSSYGWVDRQRGKVHIPIAEAMQLLAAKGRDDFSAPPAPHSRKIDKLNPNDQESAP